MDYYLLKLLEVSYNEAFKFSEYQNRLIYVKNCILFSPLEKHLSLFLLSSIFVVLFLQKVICQRRGRNVFWNIELYIFKQHEVEGDEIVKSSVLSSHFSSLSSQKINRDNICIAFALSCDYNSTLSEISKFWFFSPDLLTQSEILALLESGKTTVAFCLDSIFMYLYSINFNFSLVCWGGCSEHRR